MKYPINVRSSFWLNISIVIIALQAFGMAFAVDIGPMTWAPRSEWINVKSPGAYTFEATTPNAVGDGIADDTAAIQGAINWVCYMSGASAMGRHPTVYFPPGTYKITSTLRIPVITGSPCNLIGCGSNTIVKWYGPTGGAMVWSDGQGQSNYVGFIWDGMGTAGAGFLQYASNGNYMSGIRHENESFRNFTATGTYLPADYIYPSGYPGTGIICGFYNQANPGLTNPCGEVTILNCCFSNCTVGVYNPVDIFNNFVWEIEGCEFDNNGTGVNGGSGGANLIVLNCHFQGSTVDDIVQTSGFKGQRLTSTGSAQFYNGYAAGTDLKDCWVDGWTNTSSAVELYGAGQATLADCTFTNPPSGAATPIYTIGGAAPMELLFSNLVSPSFPSGVGLQPGVALVHSVAGDPIIDWVPAGAMGGNITSASQTFLKTSYPAESSSIYDIQSYGADDFGVTNDGTSDSTAAIQAAINAAATANNGSIVYIPAGLYNISSLTVTGGNYTIEGDGLLSRLYWNGTGSGVMMSVSNPQNITIRNFVLIGAGGSEVALKETATGPSSAVYDNVMDQNSGDQGIVLSGLPAGSKVYIPVLNSALTVQDCGPAQIFTLRGYMGDVNVSGATQPKTGYLGMMVAEGGIGGANVNNGNPYNYNFTVSDDQNLLVGPYYSEQCFNDLNLQGGSGTTPGHVAIQGMQNNPTPTSVSINVNNYAGRLFYGEQSFFGGYTPSWVVSPVQVTQTGSNHIDMVLAHDYFVGPEPVFTLDTGANLVATSSVDGNDGLLGDNPSPLTPDALKLVAQGLDDCRQLGAVNLAAEYGQANPSGLVAYWKLDEPASPAVDSSMSLAAGTWNNSPTFITDTPGLIPYADAGSLVFNGSNQYVDMGTPPASFPSGSAARTICGWAKSPSAGQSGYGMFVSYGNPGNGQGMWLGANGTSLAVGSWGFDLPFVPNFWDGNWHFICLTYDGTTASLYADGVLKESVNESATPWNLVPNVCYIGCYLNKSCYWNGAVDDVRIYNRVLSQDEITALSGAPSMVGTLITGVTASSTSANLEGTPALTVSNNSVVPGPSEVLGGTDSMGDSGFNQDASDFGAFVTNLSGANITYDLGANYNVTNMLVWNFSQPGYSTVGANSVTVQSSTDNVTFTTVGTYTFNQVTESMTYGSSRPLPGNNPPYALGYPANVPAQVIPVTIPNARYVKLVINSNYGYAGLVGLNEVNFIGVAGPKVYDLANDFNTTSDSASNTWSYGIYTTLGNPGTYQITSSTNLNTTLLPGMDFWILTSGIDPNIEKNVSASDLTGAAIDWRPGKVSFGPYQGPAVARFTAPAVGIYNISAAFQTDQIRGTETDDGTTGYVYIGGTNEFTQELTDPGAAQFGNVASFSANNISLSAGETVDFVVGNGAFTTQVDATVTKIDP